MDEEIENGRRKRLDVLDPLAACELDAKRSEKETREVFKARRGGVDSRHQEALRSGVDLESQWGGRIWQTAFL